ncbi:MAG: RnfABCDGE type electron transport complex subunit B [Steroidobacteraceae bacterium]
MDALLPQTQCMRCGYAGCRPHAEALAGGEAALNRCLPGGAPLIAALATLLGRPPLPLDPACGAAGPARIAMVSRRNALAARATCPPARSTRSSAPGAVSTRCSPPGAPAASCACRARPVDCIRMLERPASEDKATPQAAASRQRFLAHQRRSADNAPPRASACWRSASAPGGGDGTARP